MITLFFAVLVFLLTLAVLLLLIIIGYVAERNTEQEKRFTKQLKGEKLDANERSPKTRKR